MRRMMRAPAPPSEKCELCSAPLPKEHDHLLETANRRLRCACQACSLLFSDQQAARFRRVPRLAIALADFQITDAQWNGLLIPINLAFFVFNSSVGRMTAIYPSPAGPTESLLELDAWQDLAAGSSHLSQLLPDVQALLVNRTAALHEYYLVSIDCCYELVGLIRQNWKGLSGGRKVWDEIASFFANLKSKAQESISHD